MFLSLFSTNVLGIGRLKVVSRKGMSVKTGQRPNEGFASLCYYTFNLFKISRKYFAGKNKPFSNFRLETASTFSVVFFDDEKESSANH
jgi:hypothetical protein